MTNNTCKDSLDFYIYNFSRSLFFGHWVQENPVALNLNRDTCRSRSPYRITLWIAYYLYVFAKGDQVIIIDADFFSDSGFAKTAFSDVLG
ncbi:hypothetical protein LC605_02620 [Nostoc sp. CHAB 5836]|uniref:hypothetical protein n=1 Tax=Nostoc sp. CHAB 5836 TaxID=2780404 RepID=UPI001E315D89|nr:hypothetical protein [Nostoc sp. CHAB 5836]MCC5613985.1 hypothetical protein [Nostoc sp. CHAB 5836]